jgi:hypothetical protein
MRVRFLLVLLAAAGCATTNDPTADFDPDELRLHRDGPLPGPPPRRCVVAGDNPDCFLDNYTRTDLQRRLWSYAMSSGQIFADAARDRRTALARAAREDPAFFSRMGLRPSLADWWRARGSVAQLLSEQFVWDLARLDRQSAGLTDPQLMRVCDILRSPNGKDWLARMLAGDRFVTPLDGGR